MITLFCCCAFSVSVSGQAIRGMVQESDGKPMPIVNVLLLSSKDSCLVKGMVTSEKGAYYTDYIKPGQYLMLASMVGYKKVYTATFTLLPGGESIELKTISLEQDSRQLGEITVETNKPSFEQQIDRLVVNVGSSITASSGTAL